MGQKEDSGIIYDTAFTEALAAIASQKSWQPKLWQLTEACVAYFNHLSQDELIEAYEQLKARLARARFIIQDDIHTDPTQITSVETYDKLLINEHISTLLIKRHFHVYEKIKANMTQDAYFKIYEDASRFLLTSLQMNQLILGLPGIDSPKIIAAVDRCLDWIQTSFEKMHALAIPYIYDFDSIEKQLFNALEIKMSLLFGNADIDVSAQALDQYEKFLTFFKPYRARFKTSINPLETDHFKAQEELIQTHRLKIMDKQKIMTAVKHDIRIKQQQMSACLIQDDGLDNYYDSQDMSNMTPTHSSTTATIDRYIALRDNYIKAIRANADPRRRKELLPQISAALRACLDEATLAQSEAISQQLKVFAQAHSAPLDVKGISPSSSTIERNNLLISIFLNELRLGATELGFLKHEPHLTQDRLSLAHDLLEALFDFAQINIDSARSLSTSEMDWPSKIKAYQTPLTYILGSLNSLDQFPHRANLDFSILEKFYIKHCLDICRLAFQTDHIDDARSFFKLLTDMLQRIPSDYAEERAQCRRWTAELFPNTDDSLDAHTAEEPHPSNTEANRCKRDNKQLVEWTKAVNDLPIDTTSRQRLTQIQTRLAAKTTEREAYLQRKHVLSDLILQKFAAIQRFETERDRRPPVPEIDIVVSSIQTLVPDSKNLEYSSSNYWGAHQHHLRSLLTEVNQGKSPQDCLAMFDISLKKCLNLSFVPLANAITMFQANVDFLQHFEQELRSNIEPNILLSLKLALSQITVQRGWALLQTVQRRDANDEVSLRAILTAIEVALQPLNTLSDQPIAHELLTQHQQRIATLPSFLQPPIEASQAELAVIEAEQKQVIVSNVIETKETGTPDLPSLIAPISDEAPFVKKRALKAIRQQKLEALNTIEAQIQALAIEPDNLLSLAQLAANLAMKKQLETNPTVLQKFKTIEALLTEKQAQLTELQTNAANDTQSDSSDSTQAPDDNLSDVETAPEIPFVTLSLKPACLTQANYANVIEQLQYIAQQSGKDLYLFGSAIYKNQPNDLDLLVHYKDTAVLRALLAQGAHIVGKFKKEHRHILQLEWHGVKLDINFTHQTWQQHGQRLDFTSGAAYYNLRTQQTQALHADTLEHITRKELHCVQPGGSLAMLQHDPSILFRAMRLARQEGCLWSDEFTTAVKTLTSLPANPFLHVKLGPNKLYQEMERLFEPGHTRANLERLIQLNLFEKLFARVAELNPVQKDKVIFMARQAAVACDCYQQPPSFMYYAIHWPWLSQNTVADRHAVAAQSTPRIELQKGANPKWNPYTHHYNLHCAQHYANQYDQYRQSLSARSHRPIKHKKSGHPTQHNHRPPCPSYQQRQPVDKKPSYASVCKPNVPGNTNPKTSL